MPEWITETGARPATRENLQEQLRAEQEQTLLLMESVADLELALEDKGWRKLGHAVQDEFTAQGRRALASMCRYMAVSNPLIKRGINLRIGYIWGQGVAVTALAAGEAADQDVDAVVQDFWDANAETLTGSQATEELERCLGTDGEVFLAAFTDPLNGKVRIRSTPTEEIADIVTNPEDRDEPWFYIREYVQQVLEQGTLPGTTRTRRQTVKTAHPALGYRPAQRIKTLNGAPVRWDAPMLHIAVNRLDGWQHGIPDVYAAVAWARMYRDFLVDWAQLTKSLSTFAWRSTSTSKGRAQQAASGLSAAGQGRQSTPMTAVGHAGAGQAAALGPGQALEAIPKSGAHIDADSGKPLAGMAAAGLGVPVTMLLADPGVTGARATAETLDFPTVLEMTMRRMLWQGKLDQLLSYVIDQAVIAPRGDLRGTIRIDGWGRRVVELTGDTARAIEWEWPPLGDLDPVELIAAIVDADGTGKMPDLVTVRLLLTALGVKNVEEELAKVTDADGNFIDPRKTAGDAAVDRFERGEDPLRTD